MKNLTKEKLQSSEYCDTCLKTMREEEALAGNVTVRYRLSEMQSGSCVHYEILLSTSEESERVYVGATRRRAESFFELLVRNTVTPCTLMDVYEDNFAL